MPPSQARAVIGVDTGGTFTDVILLDPASGRLHAAKTPSSPDDPSRSFIAGVGMMLAKAGLAGAAVARVLHGTTVATNLILEGKGSPTALLTNAGFKYVLEIGRQDIPRRSSLFAWVKPKRPVPPQAIFEVGGRIDADGSEIEPLDEFAVVDAARAIGAEGIRAVAVVFLHSYADPAHERRAGEILHSLLPDALVSLSSEVLPVFREYERSMTTALNAQVMPLVASYVARLERQIAAHGIAAPLLMMKSSGGVIGAARAQDRPVETVLSGPAAGAVGAAFIGAAAGYHNLIGIDIGGTSADIGLIQDGAPGLTDKGHIGDWPLALPMIDLATIGAGGGSIARYSLEGALTVGPQSAGAEPGPACYGRGGVEPTVTDAHLVLGHLPPSLLGGAFTLDPEAARRAIATRIAAPMGLALEDAARGVLAIVDNHMTGAIRVVSVERGHDPRDFVLVPFGGAGPLHGGTLARLLGIKTVLVPPAPGVTSALGLLVSNLKTEFSRTCLERPPDYDIDRIAVAYGALEAEALAWLDAEDVPPEARHMVRQASLRYRHQGFELTVPWPAGPVDGAGLAAAIAAFHHRHQRLYTFAQEDTPVELVTLRVDAAGVFPPPQLPDLPPGGNPGAAIVGHQAIWFAEDRVDAPIYDRARLGAGDRIGGPAIITQLDATTLLLPDQTAEAHPLGSLVVRDQSSG
ncbi:MAG: hydantoinase/oxoprolinase family protein [Alphaproteobacteria bacterium]|nr:hydantoinase/oxoprolinase family protein [Alphaproteobacteria bacterium]